IRFGLFSTGNVSTESSCTTLGPAFASCPGFPVAGWFGVTLVNGTVLGLFFLIGGSRFFLNGGRETDAGSSLTASNAAVAVALADESTSGETVASSCPSGSSAERGSSLGRLDPPG